MTAALHFPVHMYRRTNPLALFKLVIAFLSMIAITVQPVSGTIHSS